MDLVTTVAGLRSAVRAARERGAVIGVVPTMGALHEGHLSLIRQARRECGFVVVTLFVNPTQFGPGEDLDRYPRDLEGDRAAAASAGGDLLFAPSVEEVYPPGDSTSVTVAGLTEGLCGRSRPGHFRGVATVVTRLFHMVQPDRAYFGEKDYQQLAVIRRMVRDLHFPIEIVGCPIVREPDGLAMSSRNRYLSPEERNRALALSCALARARMLFDQGERSAARLIEEARGALEESDVAVDYVELVAADSLEPVARVAGPSLLAVAGRVGRTRLIDNTLLVPPRRDERDAG